MLIYSPEISPRLEYILDLVFRAILNLEYKLTDNLDELMEHKGPRLSYSPEKITGISHIKQVPLLFEEKVNDQDQYLTFNELWEGLPVIFPTGNSSFIPFDLFAAAFYFVSRYEEYLPFEGDQHGRFHSGLSLASKLGAADKPLIDNWVLKFGELLEKQFPGEIKIKKSKFTFETTIDIDNAWAFKNKGFLRTLGAILKSGQRMERRNFRYQVLRGKQEDPFFQFNKMEMIHAEYGFDPKFFFLAGPYGKYDRNISIRKEAFRSLIRDISGKHYTGIHPSYSSDSNPDRIEDEKKLLEHISGKEVTGSRQHYLKLKFPDTYRALVGAGISEDYSMGYADFSGFRAGTSRSFRFFDLLNNKASELTVFPFQVMDTGLRDYEKLDPSMAIERIRTLMDRTRQTGGTFRCLWHNESFSEWAGWEGWTRVYREMLEMASKN